MSIKPNARILDATASNRAIWRKKDHDKILFIDIQDELEFKPDICLDCTKTGFPDNFFNVVFFDPPHWWGDETGSTFFTCRNKEEKRKFTEKYGNAGIGYYGTDVYKSKTELLSFIHKAQKEFQRILRSDGMLWLNWSEVKIPLFKILSFFKDWDEMIRLDIGSRYQQLVNKQNYWVMLMKKENPVKTMDLADFCEDTDKEAT